MAVRTRNARLPPEVNRSDSTFHTTTAFAAADGLLFCRNSCNVSAARCTVLRADSPDTQVLHCALKIRGCFAGCSTSGICPSTSAQRKCTTSSASLGPCGKYGCERLLPGPHLHAAQLEPCTGTQCSRSALNCSAMAAAVHSSGQCCGHAVHQLVEGAPVA